MPVVDVRCGTCGRVMYDLLDASEEPSRCSCGGTRVRLFSPTTNLRLAPWMSRDAEDGRARQRAFMETPEVQAKLRSGQFEVDSSNRHCENEDGAAASSSVLDRAENGFPI